MESEVTSELDIWQDFVKHPGYALLKQHARQEWGVEGYGPKMKQAVAKARAEHTDLEHAVDRVDAASDAVNHLMSYPEERMQQLTKAGDKRPFWEKRRA